MNEERRSHARTSLHVPVLLCGGPNRSTVKTRTENVSKDGFFAFTEHPFALGDRLKFVLVLPAMVRDVETTAGMFVYGEVEVVRVDVQPSETQCGIGCHLSTYRVLPAGEWVAPESLLESITAETVESLPDRAARYGRFGTVFSRAMASLLLTPLTDGSLPR